LIEPLLGGRTVQEVIAAIAGEQDPSALDLVRGYWQSARLGDEDWRRSLKTGLVAGTAAAEAAVAFPQDLRGLRPRPAAKESLEIRFVADPWLRDGRFANNAWLQELPRPLTKLVWSNAALLSPATAKAQGVENGANIAVRSGAAEIEAAAWICPGHPEGTVTLSFGFGRKVAGPVAALAGGYDAFRLRSAGSPWMAPGAAIRKLGGERRLVTTQEHQSMEGRPLARHATWDEFRNDPHFVTEDATPEPDESLYPDWPYREEAWGMAIDENACIGCMACVAACQAENNIATVGPEECARGHEMHWLRVDRYYEGTPDDPDVFFQPIPCMQCEKAPCEIVCPVNATVHTHDGLNAQVYNRCIGTRYCSQNCPYKVRRFNFLTYQEFDEEKAETLVAVHNPNVSVRSRGVMEKCTYCVQRISAARIHAQIENRPIGDGEAVTACQQVCPTRAITFGDLNDKDSHVRKVKQSPLNYTLLAELNTRPRTTYLAKVRNPNAQVKAKARSGGGDGTG
jgi:molybdopterin-containing oxidoreductase family iron-sulfur binding subunit